MIKQIRLMNFSTFCDFTADFQVKGRVTPFAFIYGENGSGKSSLVSSLSFLEATIDTMNFAERINKIMEKVTDSDKKFDISDYLNIIAQNHDLDSLLKTYKTIGSTENMSVGYTFIVNDEEFDYQMIFDSSRILSETLYGVLSKNKTMIYQIDMNSNIKSIKINPSLFSKQFNSEIKDLTMKYYGKHSFLSILNKELHTKNPDYITSNVNVQMLKFIDYLDDMSISSFDESHNLSPYANGKRLLRNLSSGSIPKKLVGRLDYTEKIVSDFFTSLFSDIAGAYYKRDIETDAIDYTLYIKKMIGKVIRDIPIERESSGTTKLLKLIPYFSNLVNKRVVIIDEMDTGIHDLLMIALVEKIKSCSSIGQLIVTTHNTLILDEVSKDEVFVLDSDTSGNKKLTNLSSFGIPLQKNHSILLKYLRGDFGGIPIPGYFDFDDLFNRPNEKTE